MYIVMWSKVYILVHVVMLLLIMSDNLTAAIMIQRDHMKFILIN